MTPLPPTEADRGPVSPCVRNCCLDDADICLGCGRTLGEIKAWHSADPAGKARILDAAAERRAARVAKYGRR